MDFISISGSHRLKCSWDACIFASWKMLPRDCPSSHLTLRLRILVASCSIQDLLPPRRSSFVKPLHFESSSSTAKKKCPPMPVCRKTATDRCGKEIIKNQLTFAFSVTPKDFQMMCSCALKGFSWVLCVGASGWAVWGWSISVEQEQISLC